MFSVWPFCLGLAAYLACGRPFTATATPPASDGRASPIGPWDDPGLGGDWEAGGCCQASLQTRERKKRKKRDDGRGRGGQEGDPRGSSREKKKASARVHAAPVMARKEDVVVFGPGPIELPLREGHSGSREGKSCFTDFLVGTSPAAREARRGTDPWYFTTLVRLRDRPTPLLSLANWGRARDHLHTSGSCLLSRTKIRARFTWDTYYFFHSNTRGTAMYTRMLLLHNNLLYVSTGLHGPRAWMGMGCDAMRCDAIGCGHSTSETSAAPCKTAT